MFTFYLSNLIYNIHVYIKCFLFELYALVISMCFFRNNLFEPEHFCTFLVSCMSARLRSSRYPAVMRIALLVQRCRWAFVRWPPFMTYRCGPVCFYVVTHGFPPSWWLFCRLLALVRVAVTVICAHVYASSFLSCW